MKKLFFLIILAAGMIAQEAKAQLPLTYDPNGPNAKHDRFIAMQNMSQDVKLPDSIYTMLKQHAFVNGYNEKAVLKNEFMLRILFNQGINKADKLWATDYLIEISEGGGYIPLLFLNRFKADLLSKSY